MVYSDSSSLCNCCSILAKDLSFYGLVLRNAPAVHNESRQVHAWGITAILYYSGCSTGWRQSSSRGTSTTDKQSSVIKQTNEQADMRPHCKHLPGDSWLEPHLLVSLGGCTLSQQPQPNTPDTHQVWTTCAPLCLKHLCFLTETLGGFAVHLTALASAASKLLGYALGRKHPHFCLCCRQALL